MHRMIDDGSGTAKGGGHDAPAARARWIFGVFAVFAALLLAAEHRVHVLGVLPWLILLACPLMHLFMHRGHGHGHRHREPREGARDE